MFIIDIKWDMLGQQPECISPIADVWKVDVASLSARLDLQSGFAQIIYKN